MGQARKVATATLVLLTLLVAASPGTSASAGYPSFEIQISTNRGGDANVLNDVSCATPGFCVAVGSYADYHIPKTKPEGTLIEVWSNGKWTTKASPGQGGRSQLNGVSCPTTTRCYAVGASHTSTGPLIVTWSGGAWTQVPAPVGADPGVLRAIDCTDATHCVAVGTQRPSGSDPLALVLDGTTWSLATLPAVGGGELDDVSCPTISTCVAVGYRIGTGGYARTVALHLVGGAWTKVTAPNRGDGNNRWYGVSCATAWRCTAVGRSFFLNGRARAMTANFAAGVWTLEPDRSLGERFAIDCTAVSNCTIIGYARGGVTIESRTPPPGIGFTMEFAGYATLLGVDCITRSVCVVVGTRIDALGQSRTFVLRSGVSTGTPPTGP